MQVGDYISLRLRQTFLNHNLDNNFFYRVGEVGTSITPMQEIATEFAGNIIPDLLPLQSSLLFYQYLDVLNLQNNTESFQLDLTGGADNNGNLSGETLRPWDALVYTKRPLDRTFKVGLCRIRGLIESIGHEFTVESSFGPAIEALRDELEQNIATTSGSVLVPIVLRRVRVPENTTLDFDHYEYSHTFVAGVGFKGLGHKVFNG